jgi:carboxymethylenebutenolidase
LAAAVPFYGNHPAAGDAAKVKAPLQIHFAGVDERINAAWPAYETALKAAGVAYAAHSYEGTQHGFNNDTTPRFDAAAAKLAWERTMGFFKEHVAGAATALPVRSMPSMPSAPVPAAPAIAAPATVIPEPT